MNDTRDAVPKTPIISMMRGLSKGRLFMIEGAREDNGDSNPDANYCGGEEEGRESEMGKFDDIRLMSYDRPSK